MIRHAPMGYNRRPSYYGRESTEGTVFIQCVDGRETQINELWFLDLYGIIRKVHLTACVEVPSETVRYFVTNYLDENGCQIETIGQLSVNDSVQLLGLSDQAWETGMPFICILQARVEAIGWVSDNYFNQYWLGRILNANIITNVAWGDSVNPRPAYFPQIPVNPCAT